MASKEEGLARLLAQGFTEDELTWIPAGTPLQVDLVYLRGQVPEEELRKAADRLQGSWVIKASAVDRPHRVRADAEGACDGAEGTRMTHKATARLECGQCGASLGICPECMLRFHPGDEVATSDSDPGDHLHVTCKAKRRTRRRARNERTKS